MNKRNYRATIMLLLVNMMFWIRLLAHYIIRFAGGGETVYIVIAVLLFLDTAVYGIFAFGLLRDIKLTRILIVPFLVANVILSVTDDVGLWDIAALTLNLVTILAFFLERKNIK